MSSNRLWVLLARKYNGELTPEEQEELSALLRRHQDTFELNESMARLQDIQVKKLSSEADEESSRQAIAARLNQEAPPEETVPFEAAPPFQQRHRSKRILQWAAAFGTLAMVFIGWSVLSKKKADTGQDMLSEVVTSTSKSRVILPDGSTVFLNRYSRLAYNKDFGVHNRAIILSGEAFFDIAHNESVPLTVTAGPVKIRVTGTAFNVRAYGKDSTIETSLIRGSIEVSSDDDPDRTIRMRPNEKIVFSKGTITASSSYTETATEDKQAKQSFVQMNRIQPNPSDSTINEIVWVQDKLVFSSEPFYSVAQKMERWYQVKIRFRDRISEQLKVTGSLEKETLAEALDALQRITPFNYKIDSGLITISKKINPIH